MCGIIRLLYSPSRTDSEGDSSRSLDQLDRLRLSEQRLLAWASSLQASESPNPIHNSLHVIAAMNLGDAAGHCLFNNFCSYHRAVFLIFCPLVGANGATVAADIADTRELEIQSKSVDACLRSAQALLEVFSQLSASHAALES